MSLARPFVLTDQPYYWVIREKGILLIRSVTFSARIYLSAKMFFTILLSDVPSQYTYGVFFPEKLIALQNLLH